MEIASVNRKGAWRFLVPIFLLETFLWFGLDASHYGDRAGLRLSGAIGRAVAVILVAAIAGYVTRESPRRALWAWFWALLMTFFAWFGSTHGG